MHFGSVASLLFALCCIAGASCGEVSLPLRRGQYASLFVGGDGKECSLRVRPGFDEIVLYSPPSSSAYGKTYDEKTGEELFYFGGRKHRFRVRYASLGDPSVDDPDWNSGRLTHQGVLGLGDDSPLWREWDSWTLSRTHLVLGRAVKNGIDLSDSIGPGRASVEPGPVPLSGLSIDLRRDLSAFDERTYESWWMNGGDRQAPWLVVGSEEAGKAPMRLVQLVGSFVDSDGDSYGAFHAEPNSSGIRLGRTHVIRPQSGLVLGREISSKKTWLSVGPSGAVPVDREEYVWLVVALVACALVWHPGISERLLRAYWAYPMDSKRARHVYSESWAFAGRASDWVLALALYCAHASFRSFDFVRELSSPYGDGSTALATAIYCAILSHGAAVFAFASLSDSPPSRFSVAHRTTALYLAAWLLVVLQFDEAVNSLLLVAFSGLAFARQSDLMLRELFSPEHNRRSAIRSIACVASAAATGWFYAFYTLAHSVQDHWPDHPSSFFVQSLALAATWSLASMDPFAREYSAHYAALQKHLAAERALADGKSQNRKHDHRHSNHASRRAAVASIAPIVMSYNANVGFAPTAFVGGPS